MALNVAPTSESVEVPNDGLNAKQRYLHVLPLLSYFLIGSYYLIFLFVHVILFPHSFILSYFLIFGPDELDNSFSLLF